MQRAAVRYTLQWQWQYVTLRKCDLPYLRETFYGSLSHEKNEKQTVRPKMKVIQIENRFIFLGKQFSRRSRCRRYRCHRANENQSFFFCCTKTSSSLVRVDVRARVYVCCCCMCMWNTTAHRGFKHSKWYEWREYPANGSLTSTYTLNEASTP